MIEEILELGFSRVELGYDLRATLVEGVRRMVDEGAVRVDSLHNFCPVPMSAPRGHPELFTLSDPDRNIRERAVEHIGNTLRFAAELGARAIVVHAGNVQMKRFSDRLVELCAHGRIFTPAYEKVRHKLHTVRDKKAPRQLGYLYEGLNKLMPLLEETQVALAIENLPTWESIPTEIEIETLVKQFNSPYIRCWHDIGHGRIRQNLHLVNQVRWLERLAPWTVGMHIHDVVPPVFDHRMPPEGNIDFVALKKFGTLDLIRVIEPSPSVKPEEIRTAHELLKAAWKTEKDHT